MVSLSIFCYKRDMGYRKKWTHEGASIKKEKKEKKEKKVGHMKVHEKREKER